MNIQLNNRPALRDLGNGLILCRSTLADAEPLAEFNSRIHSDDGIDKLDTHTAAFPDLTFLQLIFGYRTYEQLEQSYPDCTYKDDEVRVLLSTLFPKKASSVMFVN
jgi:dihydrofolate reductase